MRNVGAESRKTYLEKLSNGFFDKFMSGSGIEVGGTGYEKDVVSILPTAINVDLSFPGYDGLLLPFPDASQNFVFSSHCLEHISDYVSTIREWFRVLKVGGHMVVVVPHQFLYEKKLSLPSRWNNDHKRFYTPSSLVREIEESLVPNSYRVRLLEDNDRGYDYTIPAGPHATGSYEITLVIQKIQTPSWSME